MQLALQLLRPASGGLLVRFVVPGLLELLKFGLEGRLPVAPALVPGCDLKAGFQLRFLLSGPANNAVCLESVMLYSKEALRRCVIL